jgi:hypothetical protein
MDIIKKIANNRISIVFQLIAFVMFLVVGYYIYNNWDIIRMSALMYITIQRGIIAPNCKWWRISELLGVGTGCKLYYDIKKKHNQKIYSGKLTGHDMAINVIFDNDFMKQMLDNSPTIFGVGKYKYDFFKSFMKYNVGVSQGCPWKRRRKLNEFVLFTDKPHIYEDLFEKILVNELNKKLPKNFNEFGNLGKKIVMKYIFNEDEIYEPLFDMIQAANSTSSISEGTVNIDPELAKKYYGYMRKHIRNPNKDCLMYLTQGQKDISEEEMLDQIPHWIFPIGGIVTVHVPRFLAVLANHPKVLEKIIKSNYDQNYLRNCALEMFRLNNPVNSTFRTLLQDYQFVKNSKNLHDYKYKKGDQFLILNGPVLRDPGTFKDPNKYIPERWNKKLEDSYYALMFNQGPQRCPGKELSIFILSRVAANYIKLKGGKLNTNKKLDTNHISGAINPCLIRFE